MGTDSKELLAPGKSARVRSMFAEIAHSYDFLNHALSLNIDRRWRKLAVSKLSDLLGRPGARALDLCCGTGDLSIELGKMTSTVGIDFCRPMLDLGLKKVRERDLPVELVEADALRTPLVAESFDVVTMAFGLRNLDSIEGGLREVYRLLKPGGRGCILEFSRPRMPFFRGLFRIYFSRVLPRIGNAVSGSRFAYNYLQESVTEFPDQKSLAALMREVGFSNVRYYNLSGGIAALHLGDKD